MKNWKTTLAGAFGALAVYLSQQPGTTGLVGQVLTVAAPIIAGVVAKDSNVTGGTVHQ